MPINPPVVVHGHYLIDKDGRKILRLPFMLRGTDEGALILEETASAINVYRTMTPSRKGRR